MKGFRLFTGATAALLCLSLGVAACGDNPDRINPPANGSNTVQPVDICDRRPDLPQCDARPVEE